MRRSSADDRFIRMVKMRNPQLAKTADVNIHPYDFRLDYEWAEPSWHRAQARNHRRVYGR